jgi:uncharacterized protein
MSELKNKLMADTADAMRAGDHTLRDALRMLLAAIKQEEIDRRVTLDDAGVTAVLMKQAKQRRETIADAEKAERPDLAEKEQNELQIIERYLPRMLSVEEVRAEALRVIDLVGASGPKDMGRVMGQLLPALQGRADGRQVSEVVRDLLQS